MSTASAGKITGGGDTQTLLAVINTNFSNLRWWGCKNFGHYRSRPLRATWWNFHYLIFVCSICSAIQLFPFKNFRLFKYFCLFWPTFPTGPNNTSLITLNKGIIKPVWKQLKYYYFPNIHCCLELFSEYGIIVWQNMYRNIYFYIRLYSYFFPNDFKFLLFRLSCELYWVWKSARKVTKIWHKTYRYPVGDFVFFFLLWI